MFAPLLGSASPVPDASGQKKWSSFSPFSSLSFSLGSQLKGLLGSYRRREEDGEGIFGKALDEEEEEKKGKLGFSFSFLLTVFQSCLQS